MHATLAAERTIAEIKQIIKFGLESRLLETESGIAIHSYLGNREFDGIKVDLSVFNCIYVLHSGNLTPIKINKIAAHVSPIAHSICHDGITLSTPDRERIANCFTSIISSAKPIEDKIDTLKEFFVAFPLEANYSEFTCLLLDIYLQKLLHPDMTLDDTVICAGAGAVDLDPCDAEVSTLSTSHLEDDPRDAFNAITPIHWSGSPSSLRSHSPETIVGSSAHNVI